MHCCSDRLSRRDVLKTVGLVLTGLGAGGCAIRGGFARGDEPVVFVHLADPQLFWGPLERWEKSIACVNAIRPSFVVVGGDLTNCDGNWEKRDAAKDDAAVDAYLGAVKKLDPGIPLYNVAGNHDVCNVPTEESLAWYTERFGPLWYSFRHGRALFVVLDSNTLKNPRNVLRKKSEQLAWLRDTLAQSEQRQTQNRIVFMHHPLFIKDPGEPDVYENMPSGVRAELFDLFHRYGVSAVFCGHRHVNDCVTVNGLELVTTASCGKPLGKDPAGLRIVKVFSGRIEHAYHALDEF